MNQTILKRLDAAITSTLIGHSEDPDCNVGASICILHRGEEVYRKEYGEADKEKHHPMKPDTIFRCYSMTKPITSVAVMTLVEKGALALSDPASKYLPGFKDQKVYTDQADRISICFEINHESGALYHALSHFIYNGLNMTNIQSRPLQNKNWEYRFFVDFEGRFEDHAVQNALRGLREETIAFRILGTY